MADSGYGQLWRAMCLGNSIGYRFHLCYAGRTRRGSTRKILVTTCGSYCCYYCYSGTRPARPRCRCASLFTRLGLLLFRQLLPTAVRRRRNGPTENIPSQRRQVGVSTNGKKTACSVIAILIVASRSKTLSHFTYLQPTFPAAVKCHGQRSLHVVRDLRHDVCIQVHPSSSLSPRARFQFLVLDNR
jgi:hypothetical protein